MFEKVIVNIKYNNIRKSLKSFSKIFLNYNKIIEIVILRLNI